jgi:hypothetical protein
MIDAAEKERQEAEYRAWTAYYGSQYYGGWAQDPRDGRYKPQAVIDAANAQPVLSYFLNDREVSVTDLMRDCPANEQLQAAISLIQPGQTAFILGCGDDPVYELRAEAAPMARRRAA